jgi:hypothetical protein
MSETNKSYKKSQPSQTVITIVVVAVVTLLVALYKINRTQERIERKNTEATQSVEVTREKALDKFVDDYAEGATWAVKNGVADPEACEDAGVSSLNNLGCVVVATELKEQMERDAARGIVREDLESVEAEELSPEDEMYNEAYLEPEIN